ncbi:hypothetical protein VMCG_04995 [Cytospora schulzeri]|uniref:Uncharacterized protein n=1 Tax=Cytospora schulzeri TaxID=448051 RepID=A0A423WM77_9PEZI|nr:hypothetical protein VMCG_04995 [Valsa malicola]
MTKDSGGLVKSKAKGTVNFPPFENLDEASFHEIKRYQIYPFGKIQEYCRHIPYNSGKKDFYEKTGRESFEAVCATFCAPIAGALIPIFGPDFPSQCIPPGAPDHGRMAIDPAVVAESAREAEMFRRMYVNANAVASNGHLPHPHQHHPQQIHHYSHGPALPSPTSIPSPRLARRGVVHQHRPGSPYDYDRERIDFGGRMRFNNNKGGLDGHPYGVAAAAAAAAADSDPDVHSGPDTPPLHHHHQQQHALHRGMPYSPMSPPRSSGWTVANHATTTTTNTTPRPHSSSTMTTASSGSYHHHHQHGFREELQQQYPGGPNPLLSAIPRFGHHAGLDHYQTTSHHNRHLLPPISSQTSAGAAAAAAAAWNTSKRPAPEEVNADREYDGQSESSPTTTTTTNTTTNTLTTTSTTPRASAVRRRHPEDDGPSPPVVPQPQVSRTTAITAATSGAEKNAALLLMNLSVRDIREVWGQGQGRDDREGKRGEEEEEYGRYPAPPPRGCGPESMSMSPVSAAAVAAAEGHRSKRRRATSM